MLSQTEADKLMDLKKHFLTPDPITLPPGAGRLSFELSDKKKNQFTLNFSRHSLNLNKRNHHLRTVGTGLIRLDLDGPPHRNPDGKKLEGSHLHYYREGNNLNWAKPVPTDVFSNPTDIYEIFEDFLRYCNIKTPMFYRSLFS